SGDPDVAGVRQTIAAERKALAATRPGQRMQAVAELGDMREQAMRLPRKPMGGASSGASSGVRQPGFWQRLWHGLSKAVVVRRVGDTAGEQAAGGVSRQLLALDLAQAQAAYLAWDDASARAA